MVLSSNLRAGEVKVAIHHFQSGMAEYFPEGEDVATIEQVIDRKGMAA